MPSAAEILRQLLGQRKIRANVDSSGLVDQQRDIESERKAYAEDRRVLDERRVDLLKSIGVVEELTKLGEVIQQTEGCSFDVYPPENRYKDKRYLTEEGRISGWFRKWNQPSAALIWHKREPLEDEEGVIVNRPMKHTVTVGVLLGGEEILSSPFGDEEQRRMKSLGLIDRSGIVKRDYVIVKGNNIFSMKINDLDRKRNDLSNAMARACLEPEKEREFLFVGE